MIAAGATTPVEETGAVTEPNFALNHMSAPRLGLDAFFDLATETGITSVEIRNDLAGNAILDGTPAEMVLAKAAERDVDIVSINALQRFNEWNNERTAEARHLIGFAAACGAKAIVLVPTNDGTGRANGERQANLRIALKSLRPMLDDAGIVGLVEPLGFEVCSLRYKSEAAETIGSLDAADTFRIVHDTFHHHLAGEAEMFPGLTGLVHISGVSDPNVSVADMRDDHRELIDARDRIGNIEQIQALISAGYSGLFSFEPFAGSVHDLKDIAGALRECISYVRSARPRRAA